MEPTPQQLKQATLALESLLRAYRWSIPQAEQLEEMALVVLRYCDKDLSQIESEAAVASEVSARIRAKQEIVGLIKDN